MKSPLYEHDFLLWSEQQAAVLRTGNLAALDTEGLLEELEDMAKKRKEALQTLMRNILAHLLRLQFSTAIGPPAGWVDEIDNLRDQAETKIEDTPSLTHYAQGLFEKAWPQALRAADKSFARHGEKAVLPKECPYTLAQVLDHDFYPESPEHL